MIITNERKRIIGRSELSTIEAPQEGFVKSISIPDGGKFVVRIVLSDGKRQNPTYKSLSKYFELAEEPDNFETVRAHSYRDRIVVCLSWAGDQGGLIAIWNCSNKSWEQFVAADYVIEAWIEWDISALLSVHEVYNFSTAPTLMFCAAPFGKTSFPAFEDSVVLGQKKIVKPMTGERRPIKFVEKGDTIRLTYCETSISLKKSKITKALSEATANTAE